MKIGMKQLLEVVGVVSVVVSLLVVGYQLQQSTNIARSEAYQSFRFAASERPFNLAADQRLQNTVASSSPATSIEELNPEELSTMILLYNSLLQLWGGLYHSVQENVLPEEMLDTIGGGGFFELPVFTVIWPMLRGAFPSDFATFIEANSPVLEQQL